MSAQEENKEQKNIIKIIVCGEVRVGKTCLIARYLDKGFLENPLTTTSDFFQKKIKKKDKEYILSIWDTAGQEKYLSLNKIFFKGAHIAILVYDITNKESFKKVNFWYNEIKNYSNYETIFAIVGNKCDLYLTEEVDENEARTYSENKKAIFKLTSALENKGINDLFEEITDIYIKIKSTPDCNLNFPIELSTNSFNLKQQKDLKDKSSKKRQLKCC